MALITPSAPEGRADRPHVEKHPLWPTLRSTAGAQRSDPKTGDPALFPHGHGPQGDVIRIYNFVRLVRNAPQ
jgi:hypothetical protein